MLSEPVWVWVCWLNIGGVLWYSLEGNFTWIAEDIYPWYKFTNYFIYPWYEFENYWYQISAASRSPRGQFIDLEPKC